MAVYCVTVTDWAYTCENAAEGPDVDGHAVARAEDDLRGAVESGLDVGVDALVLVARRAEVDHLKEIRERELMSTLSYFDGMKKIWN